MSRPIVLWQPRPQLASDDACTTIIKYQLPLPSHPPPYARDSDDARPLSYIPSLAYFCIQRLVEYPDQLHSLGPARLRYQKPDDPGSFDILRALVPTYRPDAPPDLAQVDPRLWVVLVQLYSGLPEGLNTYKLPLSDPYLPLLQRVPSTSDFALITVLELPGCRALTDDTVVQLKTLHGMCAFDASGTALSAWGAKTLSRTLVFAEEEEHIGGALIKPRLGPWGLRILSLRDCMNVDNAIFECLPNFPLLSVVDLRGTQCGRGLGGPFRPSSATEMYHPASMTSALAHLCTLYMSSTLFSHPQPFVIHVDSLAYPPPTRRWSVDPMLTIKALRRRVFQHTTPDSHTPPEYQRGVGSIYGYGDELETDDADTYDIDELGSTWSGYHGEGEHRSDEDDEHDGHEGEGDDDDDDDDSDDEDDEDDGSNIEDTTFALFNEQPLDPVSAEEQQNAIATREIDDELLRLAAYRFYYAPLPPSHSRTHPESAPRPRISPSLHPLMLFRTPPAWSTLPAPTLVPSERAAKRARTWADGGTLSADRRAEARAGVTGVLGLVQRRVQARMEAEPPPTEDARRAVSKNPFARSGKESARSRLAKAKGALRKDAWNGQQLSASGTAKSKPPPVPRRKDVTGNVSGSTQAVTDKRPLKPISALRVPILPDSAKPLPKANARSTKPVGGTQTTLPGLVRTASSKTKSAKHAARPGQVERAVLRPTDSGEKTKTNKVRGMTNKPKGAGFN